MTPPFHTSYEDSLRFAVEADDLRSVDGALRQYLAWFRSERRSLAEVAQARDLFQWAAQIATTRRGYLARDLARLTTVSTGYRGPRAISTWHIDG